MLFLVYSLSIVYCFQKARGEKWLPGRIINCVDENNERIDLSFISEICTYDLELWHGEDNCILSVCLIYETTLSVSSVSLTGQLVKCTGNISSNSFQNDYEIKLVKDKDAYFLYSYIHDRKANSLSLAYAKVYIEIDPHSIKYHKHIDDSPGRCFCIGGWNKSKMITQFRKVLGIEGDKIKTSTFKFRFLIRLYDENNGKHITTTVETKPFSFDNLIDGSLVLNKEVVSQRCMKTIKPEV